MYFPVSLLNINVSPLEQWGLAQDLSAGVLFECTVIQLIAQARMKELVRSFTEL